MKNRPGERLRGRQRRAQREAAKNHLRHLAVLAGIFVIGVALLAIIPMVSIVKGFLIGFLTATFLGVMGWLIFTVSGSYGWSLGRMGEEFTAQAIDSTARHRQGWRLVNGLKYGSG